MSVGLSISAVRLVSDGGDGEVHQAVVPESDATTNSDVDDVDDDERVELPAVECPLCHDYHGRVTSVEAHITGKSDDAHKGQVGYSHREALIRQQRDAAPDDVDVDVEPADEAECPECGEGLGMTEEEAHAFVDAKNGGWCDNCGARLTVDAGDA